jgi:hypothetical protein
MDENQVEVALGCHFHSPVPTDGDQRHARSHVERRRDGGEPGIELLGIGSRELAAEEILVVEQARTIQMGHGTIQSESGEPAELARRWT